MKRRILVVRIITYTAAAAPFAWLALRYLTNDLGFNPIETLTTVTGLSALTLLVASLACTPIATVTGWRWPNTARRPLGLWAFAYALAHMSVFIGLDYALDLRAVFAEGLAEKPYIVVGFLALLILTALTLTSTRAWQRRLGKRWKLLHRGAYMAGLLAVVHFRWAGAKDDPIAPLVWGGVVGLLLVLRLPAVRKRIAATRSRWSAARRTAATGAEAGAGEGTA